MNRNLAIWGASLAFFAVAFGAFGALDLLGRFISWANPESPMPRLRDRAKYPSTTPRVPYRRRVFRTRTLEPELIDRKLARSGEEEK